MSNPNLHKDEMDRVYKVEGGGGGVRYVECHTDSQLQNIQCELSPEQIIDIVKNGENVVLKVFMDGEYMYILFPNVETVFMEAMTIITFSVQLIDNGVMSNMVIMVSKNPTTSSIGGTAMSYTLTPVTQ